jgi:hypothetical protein
MSEGRRVTMDDHATARANGAPSDWHARYVAPPGTGPVGVTCRTCVHADAPTSGKGVTLCGALGERPRRKALAIDVHAAACRQYRTGTGT